MGLFPVLFESRSRDRATSGLDAYSDFWYGIAGAGTATGVQVNEKSALKYLTVFACVSLVAGDIAKLPLILYRRANDASKERVTDHRLYDLIHNAPNPEMTSHAWRETGQGHLMLWGNFYNMIERDRTGEILYIWPLSDPGRVSVRREEKSGRIIYSWNDGRRGLQAKYARDMFHVAGFGFDGLTGLSMIGLAREAIGLGLAGEEFHARFFGEGTHPSMAISIPPEVDLGEQEAEYRTRLKETIGGLKNAHGIAVFPNGEKIEKLTMPLVDAQFIESRDHQKTEICGMYHVPPHKIALHGANSNYNNLEQENQGYIDSCLSHWVARWEQNISFQLLTAEERMSGLFFEFKLDGLLRADAKSRGDFYKTLFNMGYPLNRILAKENENPVEGGEQGYIQLNMIPLNKAEDLAEAQIDKGSSQRALKNPGEARSVVIRDRIAKRYYPLVKNAAGMVVNREGLAVKKQIEKQRKERAESSMAAWLDDFYRDLPDYIARVIGPVFESFALAIGEAAADEMGIDYDEDQMIRFARDYIDVYAKRHTSASHGQLVALLDAGLDEVEARVNEWSETRPDKIAANEVVREGSAVFQAAAFVAGLATVWRIRGPSTCPYCRSLEGKRVASGEAFVADGAEIDPAGGTGPMKIYGLKAHPPLHQGCDCYLAGGI